MKNSPRPCRIFLLCLSIAAGWPAWGADPRPEAGAPANLMSLSLEELIDVRITSVAKKDQKLSEAAAAVFVITADDIRRSGVTSLAEALRMVPGLEVARINSGSWAVSARGASSRFANKLLVLVDGRTVYTPLFSGVFWDSQDILLEDIERVEVIRGPGASLWGANAVNGVINVITKSAAGTLGGLVSASAGNVERGSLAVRYGGEIDAQTRVRAYAKAAEQARSTALVAGTDTTDDWNRYRAGMRADRGEGADTFSLQAEAYRSQVGDQITFGMLAPPYARKEDSPLKNEGAHLLGLWRRQLAADADVSLQFYVDHSRIDYFGAVDHRGTFDIEFQHGLRIAGAHDLNWGLGYRFTSDRFDPRRPSPDDPLTSVTLDPDNHRLNLWSLFVQDDMTLVPDRLHLIAGGRVEHNEFTGVEFQPNVRIAWTPDRSHTLWAAVSRAVRSPSIIEVDSRVRTNVLPPGTESNPGPLPILLDVRGSRDYVSEVLVGIEAGYRTRVSPTLSIDAAAYANRYRDLRVTRTGTPAFVPGAIPSLVVPVDFMNSNTGRIAGAELAVDWRPMPRWRLQGAYTYTRTRLDTPPDSVSASDESDTPTHQLSLRSAHALRTDLDLDLWLRQVGRLRKEQVTIPRYTALDVRLAWRARRDLELALVGQNLLDRQHPEFVSDFLASTQTQVRRSVYASLRWTF